VIFVDKLEREKLPYVYAGAKLLLFPSTYEGFGLPVLEACSCSLPVIAYPSPTIKKTFKEAVVLAEKEEEWVEKAYDVLTSYTKKYPYMKKKQEELIRKFNWDDTVAKTAKTFVSLKESKSKNKFHYACSLLQLLGARFVKRENIIIKIPSLVIKNKIGVFLTARHDDLRRLIRLIPEDTRSSIVAFMDEDDDRYLAEDIKKVKLKFGETFHPKKYKDILDKEFEKHGIHQVIMLWNNSTGYGYCQMEKQFAKCFPGISFMAFDTKNNLKILKS